MSSREEEAGYATLLEQCEEAVSELYKEYAKCFPHHKEPWQRLANDEIQHAEWIRTLRARIQDGSVHLSEQRRVQPERIVASLDQIAAEIVRARAGQMLIVDAFAAALRLEKDIIERKWFEFFETDSPELKRVFGSLAAETTRHAEALQRLWEAEVSRQQQR